MPITPVLIVNRSKKNYYKMPMFVMENLLLNSKAAFVA
jgi:hypothetical protein